MMNTEIMKMREEIKNHLTEGIIPFWKGMRDDEFGGYYGYLDYDLKLDKKAEKGCMDRGCRCSCNFPCDQFPSEPCGDRCIQSVGRKSRYAIK